MKTTVQSVVFEREKGWTVASSRKWLIEHDYKTNFGQKGVDIKPTQLRWRQKDPQLFKNYVTKKLDGGILLILGVH